MAGLHKVLVLVVPMVLLISCGGGSGSGQQLTRTTADISAYAGAWDSGCIPYVDGLLPGPPPPFEAIKYSQTVGADALTGSGTFKFYVDSDCATEVHQLSSSYIFVYPNNHSSSWCMNASQVNREFTYPVSVAGVNTGGNVVVFNNKEELIAVDVNGEAFFSDLFNGYDLTCSSADGEKLYLGNATETNDTSTPAKRPTELDATEFLTRQ